MNVESHTILLVDDNDDLREVTAELLEALGHRVLTATRAETALPLFEEHRDEIDLLVTEGLFSGTTVSGMSGSDLVQRLRALEPALGVLLISSHNNHQDLRQRIDRGEIIFLRKPFSIDELATKIGEAAQWEGDTKAVSAGAATGATGPADPATTQLRGSFPETAADPAAETAREPSRTLVWRSVVAGTLTFALLAGIRWAAVQPPSLPDQVPDSVTRGLQVEALFPTGEVTGPPYELRWRPYPQAASYRAQLLRVDDSVLWQGSSTGPRILLPDSLRSQLHARVVYFWTIDALDDEGRRLSGSNRVRFLVGAQPVSGGEPEPPS